MLRRASFHKRNGFTTIESLIAAVVFLVGLAGLLGALVQARGATGQARRLMQATDVANDLAEQIQFWDYNDARLKALTGGSCVSDPMDEAGNLLKPPDSVEHKTYVACMYGEAVLKAGGAVFGGLANPSFKDENGDETRFQRYWIVLEKEMRAGSRIKQIWVKVVYMDAGTPRVVTTQAMRIFMGGV